jgi:hypothetical protein
MMEREVRSSLSVNLKIMILIDGEKLISIHPTGCVELVDEDQELSLNVRGLIREEDGMVGFGGLFFDPRFVGGEDARRTVEAFNWLVEREPRFKSFAEYANLRSLVSGILSGMWEPWPSLFPKIPSLFHRLKDVRGLSSKLSELRVKLGQRPYKFDSVDVEQKFREKLKYLATLSSELSIASSLRSFDVELGSYEGPDLYVNGLGVEVSTITIPYHLNWIEVKKRIEKKAEKELKEHNNVEVIAIDVTSTPLGPYMWGFRSSLPFKVRRLSEVMKEAVKLAEKCATPIILYTHEANTTNPIGFLWHSFSD